MAIKDGTLPCGWNGHQGWHHVQPRYQSILSTSCTIRKRFYHSVHAVHKSKHALPLPQYKIECSARLLKINPQPCFTHKQHFIEIKRPWVMLVVVVNVVAAAPDRNTLFFRQSSVVLFVVSSSSCLCTHARYNMNGWLTDWLVVIVVT